MKKNLIVILLGLGFLVATLAIAQSGPTGPSGSSNKAHLYLFEKDQNTWQIVPEGAWGKMVYNQTGATFDFVFNGHRLNTGENYTLIYYPDPWPANGLICFGSGTADALGDVGIKGSNNVGFLPQTYDANYPGGAKIWLILSSNVACDGGTPHVTAWNPGEWLFEYNLITFGP